MTNAKPADAGDSASSQIPFVVLYAVRFQKPYELVSGRFFLMMLFLSRNVIPDFLNIRLTDSKCSVTALPGENPSDRETHHASSRSRSL
jgi:hypothetical protein